MINSFFVNDIRHFPGWPQDSHVTCYTHKKVDKFGSILVPEFNRREFGFDCGWLFITEGAQSFWMRSGLYPLALSS
jgi:hypothetical protein